MVTVSPYYKQKNVLNPYYTLQKAVDQKVSKLLKDRKVKGITELLYKNVDNGRGTLLLTTNGKFIFQVFNKQTDLKYFITIRKSDITGHYGMKGRKDTTASSNVNEILSVFFLINKYSPNTYSNKLESDVSKFGRKGTGVLNPSSGGVDEVSYEQLAELIDKDETAERDIKIGFNNAIAINKDIGGKKPYKVYWCPKGKPPGVSDKNPSDVVVELKKGDYQGYSNKISEGKDETPKFNTNMYAYFGKLEDTKQLKNVCTMIDTAWDQAEKKIPKDKKLILGALKNFDIRKEKYSESASSKSFGELATIFRSQKLDFYAEGFYYSFRNNVIKNLGNFLKKPDNLMYFLNTIFFYTYEDPRVKSTPCPSKLLIGKEQGPSIMKDVSADSDLKNILSVKKSSELKNINFDYDNKGQSFKLFFKYKSFSVKMPVTCRTRAAGGWQGKSLFITTSGLKIV